MKRVVIVGGGITGLALAHALEKAAEPCDVKLVEGFQELGSFLHDFATMIRTLPAAQVEKLVNETFRGGTFDPSSVPAATKIDEALGELEELEDAANGLHP